MGIFNGSTVHAVQADLLYIADDRVLDLDEARRFATRHGSDAVGVNVEGIGPIVMRGGTAVMQRFLLRQSQRHDLKVYEAGANARDSCAAADEHFPMRPRQIYLGLTQLCNRSCSFCVSRGFDADTLSLSAIRKVMHELRESIQVVALTGAGEALVHPQFFDAVDIICNEIPGVELKMNSSGVALGKAARRLLLYPFRNITISLNAATAETYRKVVGGSFEPVLTSIETFIAERARSPRSDDLRVTLSIVLMRSTMPELPAFVSLAFELGVEEVQGIYLMVNGKHHADESPWHSPDVSNKWLDEAATRASKLGVAVRFPPKFGDCAVTGPQSSSLPESQGQACVEPWSTLYVRPNGDVLPCPYAEASLGNIRTEGIAEIWNGGGFAELRVSLANRRYQPMCAHCCGFNEGGRVDDYLSHWLGDRHPDMEE
jgi:radical SAM protein with 4Fe4S-binding SPASM domain